MALYSNQFNITQEQGAIDLQGLQVLSCIVKSDESAALVPGQAVKLADVAGALPVVTTLTANTQESFGFVVSNIKKDSFAASERVEVAIGGAVLYMTAGGAIARGAKVEVVYTTKKVITTGGTNPVVGIALDKAAADGDLIRVLIKV